MNNIGIDISKIQLETLTILARSPLPLGGSSSLKKNIHNIQINAIMDIPLP